MISSYDGKAIICLIADHNENNVTLHFPSHDLFHICKKLNKETNQLKQFVSTSKETIPSLEFENKNFLEEI